MIQRFEDEYPECRLQPSETTADNASTHSSTPSSISPPTSSALTSTTNVSEPPQPDSDEDEQPMLRSRHNSDVSLASRALSLEEGRIHRLGQRVRNEILNSSHPTSSSGLRPDLHNALEGEQELPNHLQALCDKLYNLTGEEMRATMESDGWEETLQRIGQNAGELERLEKEAPEDFKTFREAQMAAIANAGKPKKGFEIGKEEDVAVEDYTHEENT